ncbi:hypothetical protein [Saccharolobus shibatae]|uniref:Uncharacterized protein n=1 Tax=Saccharolobus shibatae TaxID=2286 RepID=A0A8F5C0V3_9CREN|nr:hypothetical protein [Saccharolobus shibatae]QXJ32082.1 hypothetical protein J5U21_01733 [Saccharolobus shibatae]QXJ35064.1 hypothetical protein J5U22_01611 [Saccharolobus shibatae]
MITFTSVTNQTLIPALGPLYPTSQNVDYLPFLISLILISLASISLSFTIFYELRIISKLNRKILRFLLMTVGIILLGLSYYLHLIDNTIIITIGSCSQINCVPVITRVIPPPWYANLWPGVLIIGIIVLGIVILDWIWIRK